MIVVVYSHDFTSAISLYCGYGMVRLNHGRAGLDTPDIIPEPSVRDARVAVELMILVERRLVFFFWEPMNRPRLGRTKSDTSSNSVMTSAASRLRAERRRSNGSRGVCRVSSEGRGSMGRSGRNWTTWAAITYRRRASLRCQGCHRKERLPGSKPFPLAGFWPDASRHLS